MENNDSHRELVCVLFPGLVKNEEKALECLGGTRNVSKVYSKPTKKRLGLSFHPDNPYIKKTYGDLKKISGVLLKVKIKKRKEGTEVKKEVTSTAIVGRVSNIYKFDSMCDFQYVPVHREGNGPFKCALDDILPSGVDDISFITEPPPNVPAFVIPSNFTRSDKPTTYSYTDRKSYVLGKTKDKEGDLHNRTRAERGTPYARFNFNLIDDLPTEPHEYYIKNKAAKTKVFPTLETEFQIVKKMFDERPMWSSNLIRYHTKIRLSVLKVVLPCLAIYIKNGPWTNVWARFGYDPRKEPGARIYQTLDFRLRHQAGVHSMVMTRDQVTNYKKADRVRYRGGPRATQLGEEVAEAAVYFRPGMAPSQRQIFYMYCDVKIPEVEAILAPEPPPGYLCHQKRGWLPPNADDSCRNHIFRYVKETLLATRNTDLKFEQGSSDDESNEDDDDDMSAESSTDEPSSSNK